MFLHNLHYYKSGITNILKSLPTYNDFLIPTPPLFIIQPELVSNDSSTPSISKSSRTIKSLNSPDNYIII